MPVYRANLEYFLEIKGKHEGNYSCCCIAININTPNLDKDKGWIIWKLKTSENYEGGTLLLFLKLKIQITRNVHPWVGGVIFFQL